MTRTRLSAVATTAALAASGALLAATPAGAAVTCNSPLWRADYYESEADGEHVLYGVVAIDDWRNALDVTDPAVNWVEVTELGTPPVERP
ncbi:hypothetical protein AB0G79_01955 [Streptomyces sp. NPDC020807]|uniref:hypothetical protein n=1 Tax=Streptomyces sp. NPDC020807 TaxID=3155119 RepID=UPI0033E49583